MKICKLNILLSFNSLYLLFVSVPSSITKRFEKVQRDFLYGGMGEELKYHLVDWESISAPIQQGGLGIRPVVPFNQALLGKWLWRFATEEEGL